MFNGPPHPSSSSSSPDGVISNEAVLQAEERSRANQTGPPCSHFLSVIVHTRRVDPPCTISNSRCANSASRLVSLPPSSPPTPPASGRTPPYSHSSTPSC